VSKSRLHCKKIGRTACISRSRDQDQISNLRHDLGDPSCDHFFVIGGHRFDG
jgi:hypothetical protein